jgi:hypothetical protein
MWVKGKLLFLISTGVPSPKSHVHVVSVPTGVLELSVNVIAFVSHAGVLDEKSAMGGAHTVIVFDMVSTQPPVVDVNVYVIV